MTQPLLPDAGQLRDAFSQATFALTENKMRTALSVLGITVGVIAVIVVGVVTKGVRERVFAEIESYGMQSFWIYRNQQVADPNADVRAGSGIDSDDLEAVHLGCCPSVKSISPRVYFTEWNVLARAGNRYDRILLEGVDAPFLDISRDELELGRNLRQADIEYRRPVAIIGSNVQRDLFPDRPNPIGESFRYNEIKLTVIGLLKPKNRDFLKSIGAAEPYDINDHVMIPYTLHQQILASKEIHTLAGEAMDKHAIQEAADQVVDMLQRHHNNRYEYRVETMEAWVATADRILTNISLVGVVAASISLLVGGIGIMNIMTTSVIERTREIGIRKAIGAQQRDILMQFLMESAFISTFGGVLGLVIGVSAAYALSVWSHLDVMPSLGVILIGLLVSMGVGIASGYYPARRAAALRPVQALRFE
jgi:ABC-type antimicrobial peptide transport system permease subunit